MDTKIGLKYCGGCNPQYNRSAVLERIKKRFPWIVLVSAEREVTYDWVLVICGCRAECVDLEGLKGRNGVFLIYSMEKYMEIEKAIADFFE